jgi:hypothetical protein
VRTRGSHPGSDTLRTWRSRGERDGLFIWTHVAACQAMRCKVIPGCSPHGTYEIHIAAGQPKGVPPAENWLPIKHEAPGIEPPCASTRLTWRR